MNGYLDHAFASRCAAEAYELPELVEIMSGAEGLARDQMTALADCHNESIRTRILIGPVDTRGNRFMVKLGRECEATADEFPAVNVKDMMFPNMTVSRAKRHYGRGFGTQLSLHEQQLTLIRKLPDTAPYQRLKALIPELAKLIADGGAAMQQHNAALDAEAACRLQTITVKTQIRQIFDQFHGKLLQIFPGDDDAIRNFYLPPEYSRSKKDDEGEEQPEPPPATE